MSEYITDLERIGDALWEIAQELSIIREIMQKYREEKDGKPN